jgi:predicted amidohydrolase
VPLTGNLVAMHRKVHLFDIDIPGKIKFKVSNAERFAVTTTDGLDAGERNTDRRE